jgi:hypothetical protein
VVGLKTFPYSYQKVEENSIRGMLYFGEVIPVFSYFCPCSEGDIKSFTTQSCSGTPQASLVFQYYHTVLKGEMVRETSDVLGWNVRVDEEKSEKGGISCTDYCNI